MPLPRTPSAPTVAMTQASWRGLSRLASWPVFALVFLATRAALIMAVAHFTHGSELSDDVSMHVTMMHAPFDGLLGRGLFAQHPPLLPLLEGAVFSLFESSFGSSLAIRCTYALFECLAAVLVHSSVRQSAGDRAAARAAWLLLALPCGFVTSTLLPQDECIAYAFAAGALLALTHRHETRALVLLSIAVIAAKIFFVIPLCALVLWLRKTPFLQRCAYAFAPCTCVYALLWLMQRQSGVFQLVRFAPYAEFGVNAWVFLTARMSADNMRWLSLACGGALALACLARPLWLKQSEFATQPQAAFVLATAALAWFFVGFYHVNPEYYALLLPAIVVRCRSAAHSCIALLATALPWAANIAHGIEYRVTQHNFTGAKGSIASAYLRYV
ncbi:MAG: hypothetical protein RL701_4462, partial [Pseudomonadota bacterium]